MSSVEFCFIFKNILQMMKVTIFSYNIISEFNIGLKSWYKMFFTYLLLLIFL